MYSLNGGIHGPVMGRVRLMNLNLPMKCTYGPRYSDKWVMIRNAKMDYAKVYDNVTLKYGVYEH